MKMQYVNFRKKGEFKMKDTDYVFEVLVSFYSDGDFGIDESIFGLKINSSSDEVEEHFLLSEPEKVLEYLDKLEKSVFAHREWVKDGFIKMVQDAKKQFIENSKDETFSNDDRYIAHAYMSGNQDGTDICIYLNRVGVCKQNIKVEIDKLTYRLNLLEKAYKKFDNGGEK